MSLFQHTGTCVADFLPLGATDTGTTNFGAQVVLSPAFAGCGRLMSYNVTAVCGHQECDIVFQLWRPTEPGRFALIKSALNGYTNPPPYNPVQVSLSFPLDIEFAAGDMVGFVQNINITRPLEVHVASAGIHSYLEWSSVSKLRSLLTAEDAVTKTSRLPKLNVEGNSMHDMAALHIMLYNYYIFCVSTEYLYTIHHFVVPWHRRRNRGGQGGHGPPGLFRGGPGVHLAPPTSTHLTVLVPKNL